MTKGQDSAPIADRSSVGTRVVRPARSLRGEIRVPGDKSISHRALIFNAIAEGEATVSNLGPGADVVSTTRCLRALGVTIESQPDPGVVRVRGVGLRGLREPEDVLDAGNAGTTMRLLSGLLAGQPFYSVLTGDASLRSRPMRRIIDPLRIMGARLWARRGDSLPPITILGTPLAGIDYTLPVASAQLKSAILLAALYAEGPTTVREPRPSRDHTERMLRAQGVGVGTDAGAIRLTPGRSPAAMSIDVPGDVSSAAFWLVAALIHPDAEVVVREVGINPGRTGLLDVLRSMGADLEVIPRGERSGEPVADLVARSSRLRGAEVGGDLIPRMIDEVPVLAVAATRAEGPTVIRDASELRVKESDRLRAIALEMGRMGAHVQELADGLVIQGGGVLHGAVCDSHGDHRMAMAVAVAALVAEGETSIEGAGSADISYPGFWEQLAGVAEGSGR